MAPSKKRTRADDFNDLVPSAPSKDFNPDDSDVGPTGLDSENDASDVSDAAGRDHYVDVGKSKLRQGKSAAALGPQYRGSKVSRDVAEDSEDEGDPFDYGSGEGSSDEDVDGMSEEEEEEEEEEVEDENGAGRAELRRMMAEGGEGEDEEGSEEEEEEEQVAPAKAAANGDSREELRRTMAEEQKAGTASIVQARIADAEKGRAVKRQRTAFDSLLNTRIKLQKGLIATNTLADSQEAQEADRSIAAEAAEIAAFNLWSTLTDFREELASARAGTKRKRTSFAPSAPVADLFAHQQSQEETSLPHRNATLRKWSEKARPQNALAQHSRLNNTATQATIVDVLTEHLSDTQRLLSRTQTPRSCAPTQLTARQHQNAKIYDDADFYGLLLKELLEQKSQDSVASASYTQNLDLSMQMRRDAKTKRQVDTKASKGRKLRYTVHEKLQNFMAPEDRRRWGERQADELFAGLFGLRVGLGEGDDTATVDRMLDEDDEEGMAVPTDGGDGLMLFSR